MGSGSVCEAAIRSRSCPLWVINGHDVIKPRCPLYPQKRTLLERVAMSALCQKRAFLISRPRLPAPAVRLDRAVTTSWHEKVGVPTRFRVGLAQFHEWREPWPGPSSDELSTSRWSQ